MLIRTLISNRSAVGDIQHLT